MKDSNPRSPALSLSPLFLALVLLIFGLSSACETDKSMEVGKVRIPSAATDSASSTFDVRVETWALALENGDGAHTPGSNPQLGEGWEKPVKRAEGEVWANSLEATVYVRILQAAPRRLEMVVRPASLPWGRTQTVTVEIQNQLLVETALKRGSNRISVDLPAALLPAGRHAVTLRFAHLAEGKRGKGPRCAALRRLSLRPLQPGNTVADAPGAITYDGSVIELPIPSNLVSLREPDAASRKREILTATLLSFDDDETTKIRFELGLFNPNEISETIASGFLIDRQPYQLSAMIPGLDEPALLELRFTGPFGSRVRIADPRFVVDNPRRPEEPTPPVISSFSRGEDHRPRIVLLIVLDAAAAHRSSAYGYSRSTTPVLETLAADGLLFERAYAPSAYTIASTASLLTGLSPEITGVVNQRTRLADEVPTLAEAFRDRGWLTAAVVANPNAGEAYGVLRGFDTAIEAFRHDGPDRVAPARLHRLAVDLVKATAGRPLFLYLHHLPPHSPYLAPPPHQGVFSEQSVDELLANYKRWKEHEKGDEPPAPEIVRFLADRYDENFRYADAELGNLVEELKRLGVLDETLLVVTSDHGEAFAEHGHMNHNSTVYDEMVRVPLVIRPPSSWGDLSGIRIREPISTLDLFPTLLSLTRSPGDPNELPRIPGRRRAILSGKDLAHTWVTGEEPRRDIVFFRATNWSGRTGILRWPHKFVQNGKLEADELYDLSSDPGESVNLYLRFSQRADLLEHWLDETLEHGLRSAVEPLEHELDTESRQLLKALGYLE